MTIDDFLKTLPKPQDWPPHIRPREAAAEPTPTPTPVAWAVESGRGIEGLYILQSIACDRATHWGEEGRVFPLYAAPVAVPAEQRHDAATCRGERQEPDVGEGWRVLEVGETIQDGDCRYQDQKWEPCCISVGRTVTEWQIAYGIRYRRRVTPESKHVVVPAASTPLEAMPLPASQVTHGDGYRQNNADAGGAEPSGASHVELHRAVRELLDGLNARYAAKNPREWTCPHMQALDDMTQSEPQPTLTAEVERLRLTPDEVNTLERIAMWLQHHGIVRDAADIAAIATRHGGGE